jgi:GNAT superfamily N-acetyltransferase
VKSLREASPEAIAQVWNASAGAKYLVQPEQVAQNLLGHPLLHGEVSKWIDHSFVAIKQSAAGLYQGPDPKTAHLSLFAGKDASTLLKSAIGALRDEGFESLVVGMDSGHFLPGAPVEIPWIEPWLVQERFEAGGEAIDLERDMSDFEFEEPLLDGDRRTLEESDLPKLETFLNREFPGRWHYDVMRKIEAEGPHTVFGLFLDEQCEGFALLQGEGCRLPIGGAVWRSDLGPNWGSLGPIGVSKSLRGHGQGYALLGSALLELKTRGARRSIIDWTGLVSFYGAHGFVVNRTYRSYRLDLSADRRPSA